MSELAVKPQGSGWLDALVAYARREPGKLLAWILGLHLVVWTLLPILVCPNLQLDLAEDLALGKEWQLGYWKHPPLPWWLADALYRLTGSVHSVYLLGPLAAVICLYAVWRLARDIVGPVQALIAVLALEGLHFYNFSVVKFAHDQMQLPFWALTALFFYRALMRGRVLDWIVTGAMLALCFWSKYAAFALAGSVGLFILIDPHARRSLATPGPYLAALAFLVVLAPNLWWLVDTGFLPFRYVDARAKVATHWYDYIVFPLRWSGGQLFFLLPTLGLLALAYARRGSRTPVPAEGKAAFARRYVTMLALGPFAVTTLVALLLGRLPIAMWGYPLWSFVPLAVLLWLGPVTDPQAQRRFAAGALAVFLAIPLIYVAVEAGEPLVRDRHKATQFPGRQLAEIVTRSWRERFGTPLAYVGGWEFAANNVAVYSPDRPHVIVHSEPALSPWIDPADLRRRGAVLVWEDGQADAARLQRWAETFPGMELQPPLVLPRQTLRATRPVRINYAVVPPKP